MALYHTVILQAEGAIEGEADMYEVASPYETTFAFSRFDAAERKFTPDERLAAAEASATERELPERRLSERRLSSGVWQSCAFSPSLPSPATPWRARDRDAFVEGCLGSRYGCCTNCATFVECEGVPAKSSDKRTAASRDSHPHRHA